MALQSNILNPTRFKGLILPPPPITSCGVVNGKDFGLFLCFVALEEWEAAVNGLFLSCKRFCDFMVGVYRLLEWIV